MDISGINPSYNYKPRQLTIGHRLERGLAEARVTMYCNSKLKGSVSSIQLRSFVYDLYGTLWWTYKKLWKMAIEIVDFPIKNGDFPLLC